MGKTKAVVFDFGGVMTTTSMPERVRDVAARLSIPWEAVAKGFATHRRDYDAGDITIEEFYARAWRDAGIEVPQDATAAVIEADYASWMFRNERTLAWMKSLKAQGYRIGILTNMAPDLAVRFQRHFADFIALADAMVVSGLVRTCKPRKEIYEILRSRIGLPAEELLFFDDSEANCQGARDAGWRAIRFVTNEQAERDFDANRE